MVKKWKITMVAEGKSSGKAYEHSVIASANLVEAAVARAGRDLQDDYMRKIRKRRADNFTLHVSRIEDINVDEVVESDN